MKCGAVKPFTTVSVTTSGRHLLESWTENPTQVFRTVMPPTTKLNRIGELVTTRTSPPERHHPCLSTCTCSSTPAFLAQRRQVWSLLFVGLLKRCGILLQEIAATPG